MNRRYAVLVVVMIIGVTANAQPVRRQQLTEAVGLLDAASIRARRAGGQCRSAVYDRLVVLADRVDALGAGAKARDLAALETSLSDLGATATFYNCPGDVTAGLATANDLLEDVRAALETSALAQLAVPEIDLNASFEGEPAVRLSVPELTLRGLRGKTFYFAARFRGAQGNWSPWVATQAWSVPTDPFTWKNAFAHFFRRSLLAEQDFAGGRFIARVSVFDGKGRELAFRERMFQLGAPGFGGPPPPPPPPPNVPAVPRDCGTGSKDEGCRDPRAMLAAEWKGVMAMIDADHNPFHQVDFLQSRLAASFITAAQLGQLLDALEMDDTRLDAAKAAAPHVVDPQNALGFTSKFMSPFRSQEYVAVMSEQTRRR